jgi:hypothetical protein
MAEALVRYLRPVLNPQSSKAAARTWESLVRYAEVLEEYGRELAAGSDDPIGRIAERRGVALPTVRSWLHRGREAGLDAAQRDMTLVRRDPRWDEQLRLFKALAGPSDRDHYDLMGQLHWVKARYLIRGGCLLEARRNLASAPPGSYLVQQYKNQAMHYLNEVRRAEESIRAKANTLKEMRAQMRSKNIEPPTIPRWLGPLVGEDSPQSFYAGGYYAPYHFNWNWGDEAEV